MCLIAFNWQPEAPSTKPRLLLAANRDEFLARPTAPLQWWPCNQLLAGRDLQAGGTWMGVGRFNERQGKFAALTNVREPGHVLAANAPSRGAIALHYLQSELSPRQFVAYLRASADDPSSYAGFNLLVGDIPKGELWWYSNRAPFDARSREPLPAGTYGLSNAQLDTPWPKVQALKSAVLSSSAADTQTSKTQLLAALQNPSQTVDTELPATGVSPEAERLLSAAFISSPSYGTRSSTVLHATAQGGWVRELSYPAGSFMEYEF